VRFAKPGHPLLVLVLDHAGIGDDVAARVTALVDAGIDWLQVRDRSLEADALYALTCEVVKGAHAASREAKVIVNRRIDVALAAGADGAHLGFDALDPGEARALLGGEALVGVSCHSADEVRDAAERGADYAHLAPIFDPISKPAERPALGVAAIEAAASATDIPVIAQGGLRAVHAEGGMAAGAGGVAVTGEVTLAADPVRAVQALRAALDRGAPSRSRS
jgi:thiamine-phosphate pyrophosphorylase